MATLLEANSRNGSSTVTIELQEPRPTLRLEADPAVPSHDSIAGEQEQCSSLPSPVTAVPALQRWNSPKANKYRTFATFYTFVILGANDAAYGALIPYLEEWYSISYTVVSLVFLSPCFGYIASAITNNMIHTKLGQRGVAVIGPGSHLIAYIVTMLHPPYPVLVVFYILAGYGCGLMDGGWNAWLGDMANANELLGLLHGFYGLGAALSPLIATTLITRAGWRWYEFYYIMTGLAAIELAVAVAAFWTASGSEFSAQHPQIAKSSQQSSAEHTEKKKRFLPKGLSQRTSSSSTLTAVRSKVTQLTALFLLLYVGIEVSVGGWIVSFMLRVRHGSAFASGLTSTGFWLGVTVGRIVLGFITPRLFKNEKRAVATYLVACIGLELLFWLIPHFLVSAVMISLLGFFIAPMFPAAMIVGTKLLPKNLHVAALGFAAALGATGACVFPFAIGAIAQAKGVQVLQPIILAMLVVDLGVWLLIPKLPKVREV